MIINPNGHDDIHIMDEPNLIEEYNQKENAFLALSNEEESTILDLILNKH